MTKRLRQIADTVHKTVYLSEFESEMMSTAYFYRLHDVYQSSTVYLTFPCNRTKRYEHSYGTMELAGEMFFSAITNASESVLNNFFVEAETYLKKVIILIFQCNDTSFLITFFTPRTISFANNAASPNPITHTNTTKNFLIS